jgi:hypothetical protein
MTCGYYGTSSSAVRAMREVFEALDEVKVPADLRSFCLRMATALAVRRWRRVLARPWRGADPGNRLLVTIGIRRLAALTATNGAEELIAAMASFWTP